MSNDTEYKEFTYPARFVMVGKKGKDNYANFYKAPRDIKLIAALNDNVVIENISLIIPAFFHERPPMMDKNNKRVINFEAIREYIRYFGLVDLDMPLAEVLEGKVKLYSSDMEDAKVYENVDAVKAKWSKWLKSNQELTIGEIRSQCPHFDSVCNSALELAGCLHSKNIPYLFYFSGCKGFRIAWHDPALFYWVEHAHDYAKAYLQQVAMGYFTELGCSPFFVSSLDNSVYDKNKGIQPGVLFHPDSRMASFLIPDYTKLNEMKLCRLTLDLELTKQIKKFWTELPSLCPLKIPCLKLKGIKRMFAAADEHINLAAESEEKQQPKPKQQKRKEAEQSNDNRCSFGNMYQLSDEFKKGILRWMKRMDPNFNAENGFPSYQMLLQPKEREDEESRWTLKIRGWTYCARGQKHHSADTDVYFVSTSVDVKQRCFSSLCPKVAIPVYTSEEHADRLAKDKKVANAVIRSHMRREAEELEERKRREYNQRSPSPDSRSSSFVATQYLPKYTETEDDAKFVKEKPTGVVTSQWYYYRHFKQRVDCRDYYIECFRFDSGDYAKVLNLVVQTDLLEAAYLSFDSKKVAELALEEFKGYHLFVVAFNQKLQKSLVWGYCNPDKIKIDREDISKRVILRKYCYQGPTVKGCIELFMASCTVPQLYNMGLVGKSKTIFHPIAENKEEKEKQGYGFHTHSGKMIFNLENKEHVQKVLDRIQINIETNIFYLTRGSLAEFVDFFDSFERTLDLCPIIEKEFKEGVDSLNNNNDNSNEMLLD